MNTKDVYSHNDALLLKLFEMLRGIDINIVFEVLGNRIYALVLILAFRRRRGR